MNRFAALIILVSACLFAVWKMCLGVGPTHAALPDELKSAARSELETSMLASDRASAPLAEATFDDRSSCNQGGRSLRDRFPAAAAQMNRCTPDGAPSSNSDHWSLAATQLRTEFPASFEDGLSVHGRAANVHQTLFGAVDSTAAPCPELPGAHAYRHVLPDVDAIEAASAECAEEWLVAGPSAPREFLYVVRTDDPKCRLSVAADRVQVENAEGTPALRSGQVVYWREGETECGHAAEVEIALLDVHTAQVLIRIPETETASSLLIDPSWTTTASMNVMRYDFAATALKDGRVLVTGGRNVLLGQNTASCELYNPTSNTWVNAASMHRVRSLHTSTLLQSGKVLVAGGFDSTVSPLGINSFLSACEVFDTTNVLTGQWTIVASMNKRRCEQAAVHYSGGSGPVPAQGVLVSGGTNYSRTGCAPLADAEVFDEAVSQSWIAVGALGTPRILHSMVAIPNGDVVAVGGYDLCTNNGVANVERFSGATGVWSDVTYSNAPRRGGASVVFIPGSTYNGPDAVMIEGGSGATATSPSISTDVYYPFAVPPQQVWSIVANTAPHLSPTFASAQVLSSGHALVFGGSVYSNGTPTIVATTNEWTPQDPAAHLGAGGVWSSAPAMNNARWMAVSVSLQNVADRFLDIAGYAPSGQVLTTADSYQ